MSPVVGVQADKTRDEVPNHEGEDTVLFAVLYRAEYPHMVRLAHALTGGTEAAEDVVQEAFARMLARMLGRTDGWESPGGYLRTTVVNLCRDRERRRRRERPPGPPSDRSSLSLGASEGRVVSYLVVSALLSAGPFPLSLFNRLAVAVSKRLAGVTGTVKT